MYGITPNELEILLKGGCIEMTHTGWERDLGDEVTFYHKEEDKPCPPGRDNFIHAMESTLKDIFPAMFIVGGKHYYGIIIAKQKLSKDAPWWHGWIGKKQAPKYLYIVKGCSREPHKNEWESAFSVDPGSINEL